MRVGLGGLVLTMALSCTPRVLPPSVESTKGVAVFGERESGESVAEPLPSVFSGECPAAIGDHAVSYFGDHVRVRLPAGIEDIHLVEFTTMFARSTALVEVEHCRPALPDAEIAFMALVHYDDDPTRPITAVRDDMLDALGYPRERVVLANEDHGDRSGAWAYDIPAGLERPEPMRLFVSVSSHRGKATAIVYELAPEAWPLLVNSLVASAEQIVVLPP